MGSQAVSRRLCEYLPQILVRVPVATRPKSNDVTTYLMLKLVQSFEPSALLL
jgi:hypothetical protein